MLPAQVVFISLKTVQPFTTRQKENVKLRNSTLGIDLTPQNGEAAALSYDDSLPLVMCFTGTFQPSNVLNQS